MRRRALARGGISFCGCALAFLSIAVPALAGGHEDLYFGPIDQVDLPGPGARNEGTIELGVYRQHRDGRVTAQIGGVKIVDVNLHCEDGSWVGAGLPAGGRNTVIFNAGAPLYIKGGKFAEPKGFSAEGEPISIKGTVSRRKAAGTLKISLHLPPRSRK